MESKRFPHFLTKIGKPFPGETKRYSSALRWVTLFFFNIKTLAHLVGSTWSRQDNQSMCELCLLRQGKLRATRGGSAFSSYKRSLMLTLFPGITFLHRNGVLLNNFVLTCATFCNVCFHNTVQTQKRYPSGTVEDSGSHPEQCLRTEPSREISREHFHYPKSRICHD